MQSTQKIHCAPDTVNLSGSSPALQKYATKWENASKFSNCYQNSVTLKKNPVNYTSPIICTTITKQFSQNKLIKTMHNNTSPLLTLSCPNSAKNSQLLCLAHAMGKTGRNRPCLNGD